MPNVTGSSGRFGGSAQAQAGKDKSRTSGGSGTAKPASAPPADGKILSGSRLADAFEAQAQANRAAKQTEGNSGTSTQLEYTPGAVGAYPDANAAAVADMLSSAIPGMGLTNSVYKGAKALAGEADPLSASNMGPLGDLLGGDPGPQRGYQPDKFKGQANLSGIGDPGSASGSDPREIAGRAYGAGTLALTGDPTDATDGGTGGEYSDEIMLRDRRKPKLGAGTQMLLA